MQKGVASKAKQPLLTVCVITYNHEQYIEEALDSILRQKTDFPWELIIADDCSTDGTRKILARYAQGHPDKIQLILQEKNKGPEGNWLDLIDRPKTKYVLYAEADDYFTDNTKLQQQVDFLEKNKDYALCFHPVNVIFQDKSEQTEIFPTPELRFNKKTLGLNDLLKYNFIQTNSAMYRWRFTKENVKDVYPRGIAPGDWYLHILHAEMGKIGFIDKVMSVYRRHSTGAWWTAQNDQQSFWQKQGLKHLALFNELLTKYGDNKSYRNMILAGALHTVDNVLKFDDNDRSNARVLLKSYPDFVLEFIDYSKNTLQKVQKENEQNEAKAIINKAEAVELRQAILELQNSASFRTGHLLLTPLRVLRRLLR